jgi:hypothetical protein
MTLGSIDLVVITLGAVAVLKAVADTVTSLDSLMGLLKKPDAAIIY